MKKILATLLTAAMLLSVSACGTEGGNAGNSDSGTSAPASSAPTSSAPEGSSSEDGTQAPEETSGGEAGGIEGYPASLDDWTGQQFVDYFKSVGIFNDGGDEETWIQDHTYWAGLPVSECAGFWDENGFKNVMILIFKSDVVDSSEEAYNNDLATIKDKKLYQPDDWEWGVPIDHLVGNIAFSFSESVDEEFIEEMEKAYTELITKMGATADF